MDASAATTVKTRVTVQDDAEQIAAVHDASRRWAYKGIVAEEQLNAMSLAQRTEFWREEILLSGQKDQRVFVAEADGGQLVGFVAVIAQRAVNVGEIRRIYVAPDSLRKGIGKELVKTAFEYLRDFGFDKVLVWTFEENANALQFYEKQGFKLDGAQRKSSGIPKELRLTAKIEPW